MAASLRYVRTEAQVSVHMDCEVLCMVPQVTFLLFILTVRLRLKLSLSRECNKSCLVKFATSALPSGLLDPRDEEYHGNRI